MEERERQRKRRRGKDSGWVGRLRGGEGAGETKRRQGREEGQRRGR